jgi:hypothetical protein
MVCSHSTFLNNLKVECLQPTQGADVVKLMRKDLLCDGTVIALQAIDGARECFILGVLERL